MRILAAGLIFVMLLGGGVPSAQQGSRTENNRARWEKKDAKERAVLRERFAELKKLSPEEREGLETMARKLKKKKQTVRDGLPRDVRVRMAEMPRKERDDLFSAHFRDVLRHEGESIRPLLPEEVVAKIEREPPSRRAFSLDRHLRENRSIEERDVRRLGKELGRTEAQLRELEGLDPAVLEDRALTWNREHIDRCVAEKGVPPGMTEDEYALLRGKPHAEFYRRWRDLDPPPQYSSSKRRKRDRIKELAPEARERVKLLREAHQLTELTLEDRLRFSNLSEDERREAAGAFIRGRVLEFLEQNPLLGPEDMETLRNTHSRFEDKARRLLDGVEREILGKSRDFHGPPGRRQERPGGRPDSPGGEGRPEGAGPETPRRPRRDG